VVYEDLAFHFLQISIYSGDGGPGWFILDCKTGNEVPVPFPEASNWMLAIIENLGVSVPA